MSRSLICLNRTLLLGDDSTSISRAARIIQSGGLVAFPTETVYGLGASATDPGAVQKIFSAKGRPADNPLIVHIANPEQLKDVSSQVPSIALLLAEHFWPGPLSLVLPRAAMIPAAVSAGLPTVAVRMPNHRVALDLIRAAGVPIAAPSANRSGRPSPTSFCHVLEDLAGRIDAVIRSEPCLIGLESTVLDLTCAEPVILRPGGVTREELQAVLCRPVLISGMHKRSDLPRSPGMKYRHYAPRAPLFLISGSANRRRLLLNALLDHFQQRNLKVGLLSPSFEKNNSSPAGPEEFAARLYDMLRDMDHCGVDLILAEETKIEGLGLAVMNRLRKAAARVLKV